MANLAKFKKMLEFLVNEEKEAAQELFHEIVVEKSRNIYESLLESDYKDDDMDDEDLEESDDFDDDDDSYVDSLDDEDEEEYDWDNVEDFDESDEIGGDETDDFMSDMDDEDMDDEGDDMESRVVDLEDALEDLKAEFEQMMANEEGEENFDDMEDMEDEDMEDMEDEDMEDMEDEDMEDMEDEDMEDMEDEEPAMPKESYSPTEQMREYVEKVNGGFGAKIGGDNGQNTKSALPSKKNDMGGTASNIVRNTVEKGAEVGKGSKIKGSALNKQNPTDMKTGNINVPGGKAGKAFSSKQPGHGAEKKGKADQADKSANSTLNKLSSRAK